MGVIIKKIMVDGSNPSVYEIDFEDVYSIPFDDVPAVGQSQAPQDVHIDPVLSAEPAEAQTTPARVQEDVEITDELREAARSAITIALNGDFRDKFNHFSPMIAGKLLSLMRAEDELFDARKKDLKTAMRQDERLIEVEGRFYPASATLDPDVDWPYEKAHIDNDKVSFAIDRIARVLNTEPHNNSWSVRSLLELAKGEPEDLGSFDVDEANEIVASLIQDHGLTPLENGKFFFGPEPTPQDDPSRLSKRQIRRIKENERKERKERHFTKSEAHKIDLLTHGRFKYVAGSRKQRKRTYQLLTRAPRTVHPEKLLPR